MLTPLGPGCLATGDGGDITAPCPTVFGAFDGPLVPDPEVAEGGAILKYGEVYPGLDRRFSGGRLGSVTGTVAIVKMIALAELDNPCLA